MSRLIPGLTIILKSEIPVTPSYLCPDSTHRCDQNTMQSQVSKLRLLPFEYKTLPDFLSLVDCSDSGFPPLGVSLEEGYWKLKDLRVTNHNWHSHWAFFSYSTVIRVKPKKALAMWRSTGLKCIREQGANTGNTILAHWTTCSWSRKN